MPYTPPANLPRCGVVDLGSNSVRLVVFEGHGRNPLGIFNEKAVLRLGRGLSATGRLNEDGMAQAFTVLHRYHAVARAMGAEQFEVLATAAVRDARNGPDFVAALEARMPGVPIRVLSGLQEAEYSAEGVLCGIPTADGILADIGGGSLEVVRLTAGKRGESQTLRLGVIRLAERSNNDPIRARAIAEEDMAAVPWLTEGDDADLYLVGGAWRALARIHMAQTGYPLQMVHHYAIGREEARDLAGLISTAGRRALERLPAMPRRRIDDLPFAAVVLRRLLRATGVRRVVFSASGLREGWFMQRLPETVRHQDPLLAAGQEMAARLGRDRSLPPALLAWTQPLFPTETPEAFRLREAACWMSDVGSHDHPEFRPNRRSCGCCGSRGSDWIITHERSSRWLRRCGTRSRRRPASCVRPACCWTSPAPTAPRCWGSRCGWPTRCRPARRTCWPAPRCGCAAASWCCGCKRTAACSPARA